MNARVDRGRAELTARDLPYPGGDACPSSVVRGLARLRRYWTAGHWLAPNEEQAEELLAAFAWMAMWVEAGAAMLPEELQ